jgi:hypothetical protein
MVGTQLEQRLSCARPITSFAVTAHACQTDLSGHNRNCSNVTKLSHEMTSRHRLLGLKFYVRVLYETG